MLKLNHLQSLWCSEKVVHCRMSSLFVMILCTQEDFVTFSLIITSAADELLVVL